MKKQTTDNADKTPSLEGKSSITVPDLSSWDNSPSWGPGRPKKGEVRPLKVKRPAGRPPKPAAELRVLVAGKVSPDVLAWLDANNAPGAKTHGRAIEKAVRIAMSAPPSPSAGCA